MSQPISPSRCPECDLPADSRAMGLCPRCLLVRVLEMRRQKQSQHPDLLPQAPTLEKLSEHLPQLEVLELLGRGGMGIVYRARQRDLQREVAVKIHPAGACDGETRRYEEPSIEARFIAEAQILASLSHPNIVMALEAGRFDGWLYLVMELVRGPNLRQVLHREGKLRPEHALPIALQMCDALAYAHSRHVLHRDIKPENILLDPGDASAVVDLTRFFQAGGRARLADFGIARLLSGTAAGVTLTQVQQCVGTVDYMAPECRRGMQYADVPSDLYALGVVLYEMLTGQLPLGHFPPPSRFAQVTPRLDAVVMKCLSADPAERYASAQELHRDLCAVSRRGFSIPRRALAATLPLMAASAILWALWGFHTHSLPSSATTKSALPLTPTVPPASHPSAIFVLMPGDAVQIKQGDQWYDGTVVQREGRRVLVRYEIGGVQSDQWAGTDRVRW